MNQYPHLRNILILPFENKTVEIYLAETLRDKLISSFQQDGRLRIVYEEPDSRLEGVIMDYSDNIYGFDVEQNIEEYMVTIIFSITFTDLLRNEIIWENKSLTLSERYFPKTQDQGVRFISEEEAQQEIFNNLFKQLIRNSLESW